MLKNIIRELREAHNLTQQDVAKYLHVQRTTYTRYETGTNSLNFDAICRLADLYNVSTDFLLERNQYSMEHIDLELMRLYNNAAPIFKDIALSVLKKGQIYNQENSVINRNVCIPVISNEVIDLPVELNKNRSLGIYDIIQNDTVSVGDFAVIAIDDSMNDANINIGDYVIIRPQQSIAVGEIALLSINNHSIIRMVFEQDGRIALVPANNDYDTIHYKSSNEISIIGKMVKIIKKNKQI